MASGILDDLVQLVGFQPTIDLVRAWGGRRLKVPTRMHEDHALAFTVPWEAANAIAATYGGTELDIPAEKNLLVDLRNAAILARFARGDSISELSRDYAISRRHVGSVLDQMGFREERLARDAGTRT